MIGLAVKCLVVCGALLLPMMRAAGVEFRQLIDADIKAYSDIVKAANLKFD